MKDLSGLQQGSNDALLALRAEAKRLRVLAEAGNLDKEDFSRLRDVSEALLKMETAASDAVLGALGLRLRFRNMPDDMLAPLLGAIGSEDGSEDGDDK